MKMIEYRVFAVGKKFKKTIYRILHFYSPNREDLEILKNVYRCFDEVNAMQYRVIADGKLDAWHRVDVG